MASFLTYYILGIAISFAIAYRGTRCLTLSAVFAITVSLPFALVIAALSELDELYRRRKNGRR